MTAAPGYTFRLDEREVERFRAMAAHAESAEAELWPRHGIRAGATVVDLGCGPGALVPLLAKRVGPTGTVIAVDADPIACATARLVAADAGARVEVRQADAADTGLAAGGADVVMCRNVLVHNGRRAGELLAHAAALLRPGGRLISAEPNVAEIDFGAARAEQDYERRWAAMSRADGNDPALGGDGRLPQLLEQHGWRVLEVVRWIDDVVIDRSPAWAAAELIVARGFATAAEMEHWRRALAERQADGHLHCTVPFTTVAAEPR